VGDLRILLVALDALEAVSDDALLFARVKFGGQIRKLEVDSRRLRGSSPSRGRYFDDSPGSPA
jgi:hypothetical protein